MPGVEGALGLAAELARLSRRAREQRQQVDALVATQGRVASELQALREHVDSLSRVALESAPRAELRQLAAQLPTVLDFLTRLNGDVARLDAGLQGLQSRHEQRFGNWEDALNQARRDVAGLSDLLHRQYAEVRERVEFIRTETLHEITHGGARRSAPAAGRVTPRVVNAAKVEAMGEQLRLNLGCGHIPVEGYVNVDSRELPGVDVVADAVDVPFEPSRVAEIFSSHLIEHFAQEQLRRVVLPYWHGLLRPGGTLRAVLPDWDAMLRAYSEGRIPFEDLREVTFGGQEYEGDFHFNMYSPDTLKRILEEAGFTDVEFPAVGRPNGKCLEMEARARRA